MLETPLYDSHVALGARMIEFAGWEMPVFYSGINEEHQAVRKAAGLFDVSHMGDLVLRGKGARNCSRSFLRTASRTSRWARGSTRTSSMMRA